MAFYTTRQPLPQDHPIISRCLRASLRPPPPCIQLSTWSGCSISPFRYLTEPFPVRSELRFTNESNITGVGFPFREIEQNGEGADAVQPGPMSRGVSGVILTSSASDNRPTRYYGSSARPHMYFEIIILAPKLGDTNYQISFLWHTQWDHER
ncbi:hypothetical protein OG21DRAFT_1504635 [Imleria badia]|nr:hypothetical protein OG21DRAFT_1504635 [Imleria badia]